MVNEFIQVEDVTLNQKLGESLTKQICSTISYGQWIFTGERCDFKPESRGCLKRHKYLLQPARFSPRKPMQRKPIDSIYKKGVK